MGLLNRLRNALYGIPPTDDRQEPPTDYVESPFGRGRPCRFDPDTGDGKPPPNAPGLYYIRNEDGGPQYIGETDDIDRRLKEHKRDGHIRPGEKIDYKIAREDSTSEERRAIEAKKIQQHKPPRNQRGGGGGRKAQ